VLQKFMVGLHAVAVACALGLAVPSAAQLPPALIRPVEVSTCDFATDKGAADLDRLATEFNRWMTDSGAPEYAAYALLPLVHSAEIDFDVAWIGAWPDGATMGESMAHGFKNRSALASIFDSAMTCRDNRNFSMLTLRQPAATEAMGPVEASTCTLRLGATRDAALTAAQEWVDYTGTIGSTAAHWLLFPAYGERSDANYTFKWAVGYESFEAFGRDYDQLTNGSGLDRYNELFELVLRCDSPRLYSARTIRVPQ
jgi:hypothetical protein